MTETFRTFICIELPDTLKSQLEALVAELRVQSHGAVSWVKPANIHLTLRFLGDVAVDRQSDLRTCVERATAGIKPFTITAAGTGAFPNQRNPRVFWIGIKNPESELIPLQKRLERELEEAGFGKEDKRFSPHLTIGRSRQGNARAVAETLDSIGFSEVTFQVDEVIVMRSELKPAGALYTRLATVRLEN
jgi:RNA 2',3'-cyclic 3'-phosphodiesterase